MRIVTNALLSAATVAFLCCATMAEDACKKKTCKSADLFNGKCLAG